MGSSESTQNSSNRENGNGKENAENRFGKESAGASIGAAVAISLVGGVIYLLSGSGSEKSRKTMKAPGRDYRIFRDDFEDDPAAYFRDLRK
ncbi:Regulator of nonsense transcripts 3B like [Quillaja saponaria]|uniref:Regulator of nonsense transcripts 3B like n=1 Tax=Quillaja saponaria TaxID=32244 RepID=A0AAD7LA57_QUISA|nr:Regulator of nonsense transcripts 3B like [Quillaja saponaria]